MTATISTPYFVKEESNGSPYTREDLPGYTFYNTTKGVRNVQVGTEYKGGVDDPNYKVKIMLGQNCTNAYKIVRWKYKCPEEIASGRGIVIRSTDPTKHKWATSSSQQKFFITPSVLGLQPTDATLADIANKRIKSKLANQTNQFQGLVPLVELRDLRGLIRGSAELSRNLFKRLIDIKTSKGRSKGYKYAADAWLTFSFGIAPMVGDTEKLCESIQSYLDLQDHSAVFTGTSGRKWQSSWKGARTGVFGADVTLYASVDHELKYKYTAGANFKVQSANNYGINQHFGLEFSALPSVFWELTPYSWVVDYFATVGPYLEDTFTADAYQTKYVSLGRKYTAVAQLTGSHKGWKDFQISGSVSKGLVEYFEFERTALNQLPTRALRLKTVDEVGKHAVTKLLNLGSLLVGRR